MSTPVSPKDLANAVRALAMDAVEQAKSGHPGMPMGMADAAVALFTRHIKLDPAAPDWPDRDRFVLSAGHGSMLLYAVNHLLGYERLTLDEIKRFRQLGAITAGHPEVEVEAGIETTTGPLGQGLAMAVGLALAERLLAARFGAALVDHHTYVIAGDGCLMEGVSHEAASLAGHLRLGKLIVLYDDNGISIDGPTDLAFSDDTQGRFRAYGWDVSAVDGHDIDAVDGAIAAAKASDRPSLVCCKTTIGFGAPTKAGTAAAHGAPLGGEEIAGARAAIGWSHGPFEIPEPIIAAWRAAGARHREDHSTWQARLDGSPQKAELLAALEGSVTDRAAPVIDAIKRAASQDRPKLATRQCSGQVLDGLVAALPELVGGSADLTGSNNTRVKAIADIAPPTYGGQYVRYGVREFGMASAMNGLALHGGVIPFGGTFLVFTDYCRPAMRLSALMRQRVIYVMTHDSIGLGEDGPTHQPVEHLAALRAMPNLLVFRPADLVETAESWALALAARQTPSVLALTRQGLPTVRTDHTDENLTALGAYVLAEAPDGHGGRAVTLMASGSEVAIALQARDLLAEKGHGARVVSVPCEALFWRQPTGYQQRVLGPEDGVRVAIEAGVRQGWHRFLGQTGRFVGMLGFGASAPAGQLYPHFGITAQEACDAALDLLAT